jgi:predicted 3-demethylubiquinone-9 3-methyltransferase (glyoxalase superfamily)
MRERKVLVVIGYQDTFEENVNHYLKLYDDWKIIHQQYFSMGIMGEMKAVFCFERIKEERTP